jgi:hypothetical protein
MAERLVAVLIGIVSTACVAYLTSGWPRNIVINCAPFFIGGAATGFFCRSKGWFFGILVGFIITVFQATIFIKIVSLDEHVIFGWEQFILMAIVTIIITGIGGFVGEFTRSKIEGKLRP